MHAPSTFTHPAHLVARGGGRSVQCGQVALLDRSLSCVVQPVSMCVRTPLYVTQWALLVYRGATRV